jgi:hypothetical protein
MRIGVHFGPFWASTSTRRRPGRRVAVPVIVAVALAGWPFAVIHGAWVWALAVPWWIVLTVAAIAVSAARQRRGR